MLVGDRFGRWTITALPAKVGAAHTMITCRCECGAEKFVRASALRQGRSTQCKSCKARGNDMSAARAAQPRNPMYRTPTHNSWRGMVTRCGNQKSNRFHLYGARGISVCERWRDFANFFADMGERPAGRSIDRINNDGNYEPGNCRWATPKEQSANQRKRK